MAVWSQKCEGVVALLSCATHWARIEKNVQNLYWAPFLNWGPIEAENWQKWFWDKVLKINPKGGPFYVEKIFVSDSDETQNLKSLSPEDVTHEI